MNSQRRFGMITATVGAVMALGALAYSGSASATHEEPEHKVLVCHANSNEKDPYVLIEVDISSVDEFNQFKDSGHGGHGREGVWYEGAKEAGFDWGDIIKPFDFQVEGDEDELVTVSYPGLNWPEGKAIFDNECVPPIVPPSEPTIPPTEPTIPPSSSSTTSTTTTAVEQLAPTTTAVEAESGSIPSTGRDTSLLLVSGLVMVIGGLVMTALARKTRTA